MTPLHLEAAVRWIDRFFKGGPGTASAATCRNDDSENTRPTVLCISPYSAWWVHAAWEHTLLRAIAAKGARIRLIGCDGLGDVCDMRSIAKPAVSGQCGACQLQALLHAQGFGFTPEWISRFISPEQRAVAAAWAASVSPRDFEHAVWMDVAVGQFVKSSVFTFFRVSRISADDSHTQAVYRHYLAAGAIQASAVAAALDAIRPAATLVFNGRMSLTRVTLEVAKARGVPTFCHERGATKNTMTLWEAEPCSSFENTRAASIRQGDVALTAKQVKAATEWVRDRRVGRNLNWDHFLRSPKCGDRPAESSDRNLRPVVLLTSSDDEFAAETYANTFFRTQAEWMQATIAWAEGRDDIALSIRAHPNTSPINWQQLCKAIGIPDDVAQLSLGQTGRVVVFAPQHRVNTYDLIDRSDCVVVYGSTAGVEAAAIGKPVVLADDQWYAHTRFVRTVTTAADYPALLNTVMDDTDFDPVETSRRALRFIWDSLLSRSIHSRLIYCRNPHSVVLRWDPRQLNAPHPRDDTGMDFLSDVVVGRRPLYPVREASPSDDGGSERTAAAKLVRQFAGKR